MDWARYALKIIIDFSKSLAKQQPGLSALSFKVNSSVEVTI